MGLLDRFRAGGLRPAWTYSTSGTLWRVIPAPPETVIGEERDTKAKRATFFALDLNSGRRRWSGRRFHDDWWVGVTAVHQDVLLLHGFASPDMPGHLGIVAADIASGDILWSDPAGSLVELRTDIVVLSRPSASGPDLEARALRTGAHTALVSGGNHGAGSSSGEDAPDIRVPYLLAPDEDMGARLNRLLRPLLGGQSTSWHLEVVEHPRAIVVMTHEPSAPSGATTLRGHLRVVDPEAGSLLFEEITQREVQLPVPNTFSIVQDKLLYIKDGQLLRAVPL